MTTKITIDNVRESLVRGHINLVGDVLDPKGRPVRGGEIDMKALLWLGRMAAAAKVAVESAVTGAVPLASSGHPSIVAAQAILNSLAVKVVERIHPQRHAASDGHWESGGPELVVDREPDPAWLCIGQENDPGSLNHFRWYARREAFDDEELAHAWEEAAGYIFGQQPVPALTLALLTLARRTILPPDRS